MKVVIFIFLALLLLGCTSPPAKQVYTPTQQPPVSTPPKQASQVVVHISGSQFQPADITVSAGTNVTWVNDDSVMHTVVSDDGKFNIGNLQHGDSGSMVFNQVGTYAYHCSIHPSMKGSVTVK
jgi:plastocyanin